MENCAKVNSMLGAYVDGELGSKEARDVAVHLKQCSVCEKSLQELKAFTALSATYEVDPVSDQQWEECFAGCLDKIRQGQPDQNQPKQDGSSSSLPYWWLICGAAIAAALLAYILLSPILNRPNKPAPTPGHSPVPSPPQMVYHPEKAPINKIPTTSNQNNNNESHVEYLETGEDYTSSIDVPSTKEEMCVITVEKQE